jgi:hypothetical protein
VFLAIRLIAARSSKPNGTLVKWLYLFMRFIALGNVMSVASKIVFAQLVTLL